jgi:hypothetical protein
VTGEAPEDLAVAKLRQIIATQASEAPPGSPEQQRLLAKLALSDEELLDSIYSHVNANPDRVGCPPHSVLVELATRVRPVTDPLWEHVIHCSPCAIEVRTLRRATRQAGTSSSVRRLTWAAAAVLMLGVGGALWWFPQRDANPIQTGNAQPVPVATTLDLRPYAVSRSEAAPPAQGPLRLPRGRVNLTMLLPVGSDVGHYELQVLDANLQSRASAPGDAVLQDFVTRLTAVLDLRSLPAGAYQLALRRTGEDWHLFPAHID